jgi:hypothetical protein
MRRKRTPNVLSHKKLSINEEKIWNQKHIKRFYKKVDAEQSFQFKIIREKRCAHTFVHSE